MKFTKEEISLCKQIAERYRKEIKKGDWLIYEDSDRTTGWSNPTLNSNDFEPDYGYGKNVLIWTISDCLEFFEERGFYLEGLCQVDECEYELCISEMDDMGVVRHSEKRFNGITRLTPCLKAVLAVLGEKK